MTARSNNGWTSEVYKPVKMRKPYMVVAEPRKPESIKCVKLRRPFTATTHRSTQTPLHTHSGRPMPQGVARIDLQDLTVPAKTGMIAEFRRALCLKAYEENMEFSIDESYNVYCDSHAPTGATKVANLHRICRHTINPGCVRCYQLLVRTRNAVECDDCADTFYDNFVDYWVDRGIDVNATTP